MSPDWHRKPTTIISIISLVFALAAAWTTVSYKVVALEKKVAKHEKVPLRLQRLEDEQSHVKDDVKEIKELVKQNQHVLQNIDRYNRGLPRR